MAREHALAGREYVETVSVWRSAFGGYNFRLPSFRRSRSMPRARKSTNNIIPLNHRTVAVPIDHDVITRFRKDAAARELTVPRLIADLLTTIADDHLVTAVLDDQDQPQ
jgi:hypothetical protein